MMIRIRGLLNATITKTPTLAVKPKKGPNENLD